MFWICRHHRLLPSVLGAGDVANAPFEVGGLISLDERVDGSDTAFVASIGVRRRGAQVLVVRGLGDGPANDGGAILRRSAVPEGSGLRQGQKAQKKQCLKV